MRIGIDCRLAGHRHAGIGRYVANLVVRLPALNQEITWVFFFSDQDQATEVLGSNKPSHVEVVLSPIPHYSLAEQFKLLKIFNQADLDLLHIPHFNVPIFYSRKLVITIHDLLWHEYKGLNVTTLPAWIYWFKYAAYRWITSKAVRKAQVIFVPAQTIKKILSKYYPQAAHKVVVTKEGALPGYLRREDASNNSNTLLYIGSLYPHKNITLVLKALKNLQDYQLIVIGSRNVFQDKVRQEVASLGIDHQVTFAGYIPDDKLPEYFSQALALVQPSLSEGFGLTGVEALSAGLPVLASNIPIFNEIYKDAALYFNPHSVESFVNAVHKLQHLDRSKLISRGQKVTKEYNWDAMVEQTLATYLQVTAS